MRSDRIERNAVVFVAGATTLAVEVLALRALTPPFGGSVRVWGAVLSVTLLALAAGYQWGGRLGDRHPAPGARLVQHVLLSAVWLAALPFWDGALLELGLAAGSWWGPLVASGLLLGLPMLWLATVVPLAFRASFREDHTHPGGTVGGLFAISTVGSVLGALATAYFLIPGLGISRSFLACALVLLLALMPYLWRGVRRRTSVALLTAVCLGHLFPPPGAGVTMRDGVRFLHRQASRYSQIDVIQDDRQGVRVMMLDGLSQSWMRGRASAAPYVEGILEAVRRNGSTEGRALVIGLGAGALSEALGGLGYEVEVVEIDPQVLEAAVRYFDYPVDRAPVHLMDGRAWLRRAVAEGQSYDLVVLDVAGSRAIEHFYTAEAMDLYRRALTENGLLLGNHVALFEPDRDRLPRHVLATAAAAFPSAALWDAAPDRSARGGAGQMLLAASPADRNLRPPDAQMPALENAGARPLTDDWNPAGLWMSLADAVLREDLRRWAGDAILVPR